MSRLLRQVAIDEVPLSHGGGLPERAIQAAREILARVEQEGEPAVRRLAEQFGDLHVGAPLVVEAGECQAALQRLAAGTRDLLERTAERIRAFAEAQRDCLRDLDTAVPGGRAGHRVEPLAAAGCYAPGGRYPLPSSVLMTVIPARVAGVAQVTVASPRPGDVTLAAAAVAGADQVLAVGGAQALAAMAFGVGVPRADILVGPGNVYVAAAKQLLAGRLRIDMVAGPSELLVLADQSAPPAWIAADLLAQAEHDPLARPILLTHDQVIVDAVEEELQQQLQTLPTADVARQAFQHGFAVICDLAEACALSDRLAPEHLQVMTENASEVAQRLYCYGGLFLGSRSAEVFGDYGLGPNHVLPTGGLGRMQGGLSVLDFMAVRTWMQVEPDPQALDDAATLARLEGLEAHARAAEIRR